MSPTSTPLVFQPGDDEEASPFGSVGTQLLADIGCIGLRRELSPEERVSYPWFSEAIHRVLGLHPDEVSVNGQGALNLIHWADREQHRVAVMTSARDLTPCHEAFRAITAEGETRWLKGVSYPRRLGDGRVVWDGVWMDDTLRMRAEDQHQMLMDQASDCIFILDGDMTVTWCNASAERHFGRPLDQITGCDFADILAADNAGMKGATCETYARRADGTTFPFEMTVSEIRRDGRLSLIVIGRDISRRRRAARLLEQSEQRLSVTFAAASMGIVVVGRDGTIRFHNPAFAALSECEAGPKGTVGGTIRRLLPDILEALPETPLEDGESFVFLCNPTLPSGEERHWRLSSARFLAAPEDVELSWLFIIEDVTEATRAQADRRQMEELLRESQKLESLGRLAGGVAHELNNMLGPILMGAEMVARTAELDPRNTERIQRVVEAAKSSRDIVRNILAYCRKESATTLSEMDVVPLVENFAGLATSILPAGITLRLQCPHDRALVRTDSGQIQQILLNLVNNARDAMYGEGVIELRLKRLTPYEVLAAMRNSMKAPKDEGSVITPLGGLDHQRPHIRIQVKDTGSGIPPSVAARMFDPFFTTKAVGQGTGLGLSMVHGIVKAMNGAISVESEIGKGSTFSILLPLAE